MNRWVVLLLALSGCAQPGVSRHRPSVHNVDWSGAPEMAAQAERLRRIGNEVYPQIRLLLKDAGRRAPRCFDIVFTNQPGGNVGQTIGATIHLNAHYVAPDRVFKSASDLDAVLVHEMTHGVQQYDARAPAHWGEGMADYVCAKLGYTNALNCPVCSPQYPHYRSGYQCAGAFLLFVESRYAPNVIPELHRKLRGRSYTDSFFSKISGKPLDELWSEFQQTAAFTLEAQETHRLQQALGFVDGNPPPDVVRRAEAHFRLPSGAVTNAIASLIALKNAGRLPGFAKDERGSATFASKSFQPETPGTYPLRLTLYVQKMADASLYSFTVAQSAEHQPWQLQSAQRLSADHRTAEELPVPSP